MEISLLTVVWILVIGAVVGLLAWLGPRPTQWRSHQRTDEPGADEIDEDSPETH